MWPRAVDKNSCTGATLWEKKENVRFERTSCEEGVFAINVQKIIDGWPGVQTSWLALSSVGIAADLKMPQEG